MPMKCSGSARIHSRVESIAGIGHQKSEAARSIALSKMGLLQLEQYQTSPAIQIPAGGVEDRKR